MNQLTIDADLSNLDQVNAFVESYLESIDCPPRASMQLMVALEELFVNVCHYAYAPASGPITIRLSSDQGASITLIDSGTPFNPLTKSPPDTTLPAEDRPIGGLGIHMVKKTMDVFTYDHANGQNVVTIGKRW